MSLSTVGRIPRRLARGTTSEVAAYTGPAGEPVYNTETKRLHMQDGSTPGGLPSAADVFAAAGTGALTQTLQTKLRQTVSLADFSTAAQAVAASSGSRTLHVPKASYAIPSDIDIGLGILEIDGGAAFTGSGRITPSGLTFTSSERFGKKFGNTSIDAYSIYGGIFPDVSYYDVMQVVAQLPEGSDLKSHISAIAGYIVVDDAISSIGNNAVALFGGGTVNINNGAGWGINVLLQDAPTRTAHSGTGRVLLGGEFDFNVMSPNTQVIGISVGGNSLAQPTNASAFICNTLNSVLKYKWTTAFASFDECAGNAFYMGLKEAGVGKPSQDFLAAYTDGSGVKQALVMRVVGGVWNFVNGDLALDSGNVLLQTGKGVFVNGSPVVGGRKTGWTAGIGLNYRGAGFDSDYTQVISATYQQTEVQAIMDVLQATRRRLLSLERDMRGHGLID